jgi:hypothetical protein
MGKTIPGEPASLVRVVGFVVAGLATPIFLAEVGRAWNMAPLDQGRDMVAAGLSVYALMLIPASIFAPAVGSMFPNFDRSTPITLIDDGAIRWLLRLVAFGLAFGASTLGFDVPVTAPVLAALGATLGSALVLAIWLIQHSLSIFDPDYLSAFLAQRATQRPLLTPWRRSDPNQPVKDLCRLVRGYLNAQRPSAAEHAIDRLTEVWRLQGKRIDEEGRQLAARVIGEARAQEHWQTYLALPIERFVSGSGIKPNPVSESIARLRLAHEEPWLTESPTAEPSLVRMVFRLIQEWFGPI